MTLHGLKPDSKSKLGALVFTDFDMELAWNFTGEPVWYRVLNFTGIKATTDIILEVHRDLNQYKYANEASLVRDMAVLTKQGSSSK